MENKNFEFRLSFFQLLFNPIGHFVLPLSIMSFLLFYLAFSLQSGSMVSVIFVSFLFLGFFFAFFASIVSKSKRSGTVHQLKIINDETFEMQYSGKRIAYNKKLFKRSKDGRVKCFSGYFGCKVLGLVSGHTLVLPNAILKEREFEEFLNG